MIIVTDNGCSNCGLYQNQLPLLDSRYSLCDVLWVGLSAKMIKARGESAPLGADTNSGKIINRIEGDLNNHVFAKTNLVKCAPLDQDNKLRYPTYKEMKSCFCHLQNEVANLGPRLVFLLGLKVATFVLREKDVQIPSLDSEFNYGICEYDNVSFVPIHHPSFIHIYKRRQLDQYISKVQAIISQTLDTSVIHVSGKAS